MPFVCDRKLEDMLNPGAATVASRAMTEKGTDRLLEATTSRTPIDTSFTPFPRERVRGTARASIKRDRIRATQSYRGRGYRGRVYTEDKIFPYIEWNTRPHMIAPTPEHVARAATEGRQAMLRWYSGGVRFRPFVNHPGTTGQHPFARAAAWLEIEVPFMFDEELARFAVDLTSRVLRVEDLLAYAD